MSSKMPGFLTEGNGNDVVAKLFLDDEKLRMLVMRYLKNSNGNIDVAAKHLLGYFRSIGWLEAEDGTRFTVKNISKAMSAITERGGV
ncbi:hypothetical protein EHM76_07345 [bacterium]|nr:MAG: hypothetical protein EHM76_07345 [bacterium]